MIVSGEGHSGSVVECLTQDWGLGSAVAQWLSAWLETEGPRVRASPASLRCGPWARHIYPSLVLVKPRKTRPYITERLLMGRKESNQTNKIKVEGLGARASMCPWARHFILCLVRVQPRKTVRTWPKSWWLGHKESNQANKNGDSGVTVMCFTGHFHWGLCGMQWFCILAKTRTFLL